MHKYILLLLISVFSFSRNHAQTRLSVSSEYLMPMGKMKWPYKPGIGADINLAKINDDNTLTKFVGISIGYAALQPHADTLYYVYDYGGVDGIVVGRAAYSSFKMLRFKVNLEYALPLGKKVDFT